MPVLDEPISPELALVCPELRAEALRALPPPPRWEVPLLDPIAALRPHLEPEPAAEPERTPGPLLGALAYGAARAAEVALQGAAVVVVLVVLLLLAHLFE